MKLFGPEKSTKSGNKAEQLVVFIHGLGADGNDLISLAPIFAKALPDAHFVSPNAPFDCDMAPMGYQWFSLQNRTEEAIYSGIQKAVPILSEFIDDQLEKHSLTHSDLILIGFSQGTMMALHIAPRFNEQCKAVIGFSGALISPKTLANEYKTKPPILLIHGDGDEIVPPEALEQAKNVLETLNFNTEEHLIAGLGHGIDESGINYSLVFLNNS
jgi:phospholipase/carboxylesterase